ncbi:hypothetical protein OSB04_001064 [Centaurea solstitialis]|uniref:Protein kinase domain-containing protein n=1 Tax=Centaurea solstitialis TaxID=347529 RepID=A0AA38TXS8_9ASTR|nr:hypothetical protein OSB04_001064 [Centaurea solstitialis]
MTSETCEKDSDSVNLKDGLVVAGKSSSNNISLRTGEEFSMEFLQDRGTKRIPNGHDMDLNHPRVVGSKSNVNGMIGSQRRDSVCSSSAADVISATGSRSVPSAPVVNSTPSLSHRASGSGVSDDSQRGKIKFLCSSGGKILRRPSDGKLRYVGGETHIFSIQKNMSFDELVKRTGGFCNQPHTIKYQLPGEDLDALISVSSDEDLQNMIEEYNGIGSREGSARLRIFLVPLSECESTITVEANASLQNDLDYQYVAAVNGIVDDSPMRNNDAQLNSSLDRNLGLSIGHSLSFNPTENNAGKNIPNVVPNISEPQILVASSDPSLLVSPVVVPQDDLINGHAQVYKDSPSDSIEIPILKGRAFHSENRILHPSDQVNKYVGPNASNLGMPHAFSDPQLQELGANSAFGSQDGSNLPSTLTFVPLLPSQLAPGKSVEQLDTVIPNVSPSVAYSGTDFLQGAIGIGREDAKEHLNWNGGLQNDHGRNGPPFLEAGNFVNNASYSPAQHYINEPSKVNHEQIPFLVPSSAPTNPTPVFNALMQPPLSHNLQKYPAELATNSQRIPENQQHVYTDVQHGEKESNMPRKISMGITNADRSLNDLLSYPSDGLGFNVSAVQPPISHQKESNGHRPMLIGSRELHPPISNGAAMLESTPLDISFMQIPTTGAEFRREVNLIDGNFNHTSQKAAKLGHEERHNKVQQEIPPSKEQKQVELNDFLGDVTSQSQMFGAVGTEAPPSSATEAEHTLSDLSIKDAGINNEGQDGPFNNALIAEMEADMYGLQIIKNAELEELRELGSGTYGTVYHGRWRGSDVAIKRIKKSCFSGRSSEQERLTNDFWREARILSNLHHPNVVAFYGVVPDGSGGTLATVTEFMTHGSLRNVLIKKDRSLDRRRKLIIAMDAAFGMEYLHLKNIVHFDLKCDNLLVNMRDPQRPICKVGDFGLSRIKRNTLVSGGVRGTLPWMAPELLNGSTTRVSEKVDVFSFGITMWEILTGEEPYANMHCGAIIGGIVKDTLRPTIPERCDPEWRNLMEQCWSANPIVRPSFTEITNRLRVMSKALEANAPKKGQHI